MISVLSPRTLKLDAFGVTVSSGETSLRFTPSECAVDQVRHVVRHTELRPECQLEPLERLPSEVESEAVLTLQCFQRVQVEADVVQPVIVTPVFARGADRTVRAS
ncbi:hypothetical protein [Nocardia sp. NPDC049149]|uniref:hypothetical protein n=1 Tax=Nocardia sp. NPDC049149 TaxID=3364315 RepID=UPI0037156E2C